MEYTANDSYQACTHVPDDKNACSILSFGRDVSPIEQVLDMTTSVTAMR